MLKTTKQLVRMMNKGQLEDVVKCIRTYGGIIHDTKIENERVMRMHLNYAQWEFSLIDGKVKSLELLA